MSLYDGGCAFGFKTHHLWGCAYPFHPVRFLEAHPICGDIASVAHGDEKVVGRDAEVLNDFERCGFLSFQPVGVDRINEHDRVLRGEFAHDAQSVVEATVDEHDSRAVCNRLCKLAARDVFAGDDDDSR